MGYLPHLSGLPVCFGYLVLGLLVVCICFNVESH